MVVCYCRCVYLIFILVELSSVIVLKDRLDGVGRFLDSFFRVALGFFAKYVGSGFGAVL